MRSTANLNARRNQTRCEPRFLVGGEPPNLNNPRSQESPSFGGRAGGLSSNALLISGRHSGVLPGGRERLELLLDPCDLAHQPQRAALVGPGASLEVPRHRLVAAGARRVVRRFLAADHAVDQLAPGRTRAGLPRPLSRGLPPGAFSAGQARRSRGILRGYADGSGCCRPDTRVNRQPIWGTPSSSEPPRCACPHRGWRGKNLSPTPQGGWDATALDHADLMRGPRRPGARARPRRPGARARPRRPWSTPAPHRGGRMASPHACAPTSWPLATLSARLTPATRSPRRPCRSPRLPAHRPVRPRRLTPATGNRPARHLNPWLKLVTMPPEIAKSRVTNRTLPRRYGRDHVATPLMRFVVSNW